MIELYNNLMKLCESKSFFFKDEVVYGSTIRIFGYRYCSYEDWLKPGAIECRGIAFELDNKDLFPIRIACRPMEKFFNLNENDFTRNIDPSKIVRIMEKIDGSLVSTFMVDELICFKSKTTANSDQALFARNLAYDMGHEFVAELIELDKMGYTVNMEYVAPTNRVVIPYQEEKLIVLNVRCKHSGRYMPIKEIKEFPKVWENFVDGFCVLDKPFSAMPLINYEVLRKLENIEGYIWVMDTGQMVKVKTDWYVAKHKAKDGALNFRYCLETVLNDKSDDIRAALSDDPAALELLNRVEKNVREYMSTVLDKTERFYNENKALTRKEYALKGQREVPEVFHLAMLAYTGQELDVAGHVRKKYDEMKELCDAQYASGLRDE